MLAWHRATTLKPPATPRSHDPDPLLSLSLLHPVPELRDDQVSNMFNWANRTILTAAVDAHRRWTGVRLTSAAPWGVCRDASCEPQSHAPARGYLILCVYSRLHMSI